jgi:hypothetical protein
MTLEISDAISANATKTGYSYKSSPLRTKNYVDDNSDLKDDGFDGIRI